MSEAAPGRPRIELIADVDHPGGTMVLMDAVRQSYVDIDDPEYLDFEYVQYLANLIELLPAGPLTVTHIGGGGLTLPRYLNSIRPDSVQLVLEPDVELTEIIRAGLPLPRRHRIRIRPVAGREGMAVLGEASADVIVLDAFADGRVPAELTTVEFFVDVSRVLRADGVFLANLVDERGLAYLGRVIAGLRATFTELALVAATDVLKGRRFGNIVVAASSTRIDMTRLARSVARQPFPATVRDTDELASRFGTARPFNDDDSSESPEPRRGWRIS